VNKKTITDEVDGGESNIVIGSVSRVQKKFPIKKLGVFGALVILGILIILLVISLVKTHHNNTVKAEKVDTAKVQALLKSQNCSNAAIESVSKENPNQSQLNASVDLLSYRVYCDIQTGKNEQALAGLKAQSKYYIELGDTINEQQVEQKIKNLSYNIAHPTANFKGSPKNDLTPEQAKQVDIGSGTL
jgi:hypothetical protein